jgi:hypothetical protein
VGSLSCCRVSSTFFRALDAGTVPVVLGEGTELQSALLQLLFNGIDDAILYGIPWHASNRSPGTSKMCTSSIQCRWCWHNSKIGVMPAQPLITVRIALHTCTIVSHSHLLHCHAYHMCITILLTIKILMEFPSFPLHCPVAGAPNVLKFSPGPRSIIRACDFDSQQDLADYLVYLDRNDTAYR